MPDDFPPEDLDLHLQDSERSTLGGIRLAGEIRNSRGTHLNPDRRLGAYALVYTLAGKADYWDASYGARQLRAGDMLLLFPEIPHRYSASPGHTWHESFVIFDGPVFDLWRQEGLLDPATPILHAEPVDYWRARLQSCVEGTSQFGQTRGLFQLGLLQTLLADLRAVSSPKGLRQAPHIQEACRHLGSGTLQPVDLQAVARRHGMTERHLRDQFKTALGLTPSQYRLRSCIDHACRLVLEGRLSGKEIAATLGFHDEFHFSRRFKQIVGVSPRSFRNRDS